ncbi:MAG: OmpA family protein [Proteobacteria bacterium]|nr:OmpA family protein [Pseudomonadota bacterium]
MLKLRPLLVATSVLCCVLSFLFVLTPRVSAQDRDSDGETATELLEDGLDALSDHAEDSGRRLLGRVISDYPGSPEARRAKRALTALDRGELDPEYQAQLKADEAERTAEYRHAFLLDIGDRVFFAEGSAAIGGRAHSIIEQQARWLNLRPDLSVVVIGRADGEGDLKSARELSMQRAGAVRDRLVAAGLSPSRIDIKAAGNEDRVAICGGPLCEAQNRNAEVLINAWHFSNGWRSSQQVQGLSKSTAGAASSPRSESTSSVAQ